MGYAWVKMGFLPTDDGWREMKKEAYPSRAAPLKPATGQIGRNDPVGEPVGRSLVAFFPFNVIAAATSKGLDAVLPQAPRQIA